MSNDIGKYIVFEKDTIAKLSQSLNEIDDKFNLLITDIEKANQQNDILRTKVSKLEYDNDDLKFRNKRLGKLVEEMARYAVSRGNFSNGVYSPSGECRSITEALDYFKQARIKAEALCQ